MTEGKQVQDFIKEQKKTAKELFEEAGYRCISDSDDSIIYLYEDDNIRKRIIFDTLSKFYVYANTFISDVDMETLKLIIAQCKELGWL